MTQCAIEPIVRDRAGLFVRHSIRLCYYALNIVATAATANP